MQVTTPLLKFMAEFVLNKSQRLTFDCSSPNGILLFREVSKLIVAYGSRVLSFPISADIYSNKYKGIWISLTIITRGKNVDSVFTRVETFMSRFSSIFFDYSSIFYISASYVWVYNTLFIILIFLL